MERLKIIAVDFDGTLCTNSYPKIGEANIRLISILKTLQKNGCQLILWTCRCGSLLEDAVEWCSKFQLYFDAVNENVKENLKEYGTDSRKVYEDVYIDDKSCFPWKLQNSL